ncbi:MAG: GTP-binding protein [Candidatus Heimdallarchaeota archaeon]|nr:MAG: GTP-binding protein [Candidatus Heimdallarchaeota archaeon]
MSEDHRLWKIVLVGDGAVGKTSLRKRYLGEGFETDYLSTMGADFALYDTNINETHIRWQIWDLAGQPVFKDVVKAYYTKIFGGVLVYDVTRRSTFENVEKWLNELQENSKRDKTVPVVLFANKIDLQEEGAETVSPDEGKALADRLGLSFYETSAKTGEMVTAAFEKLGKEILDFTS